MTTQIQSQDILTGTIVGSDLDPTIAIRESPVTTANETVAAGYALLAITLYEVGNTFVTEISSTSTLEII